MVQDTDVGGVSVTLSAALDDSPGILIKATQCLLYGWHIKNTTAAALYVQFFNVAALASVTLGTTAPDMSIGIEANGMAQAALTKPIYFTNGLAIFSTTTATGSTAAASDVNTFWA